VQERLDIYQNPNLYHLTEAYDWTFEYLKYQEEAFKGKISFSANIGLIKINTEDFRLRIIDSPF